MPDRLARGQLFEVPDRAGRGGAAAAAYGGDGLGDEEPDGERDDEPGEPVTLHRSGSEFPGCRAVERGAPADHSLRVDAAAQHLGGDLLERLAVRLMPPAIGGRGELG